MLTRIHLTTVTDHSHARSALPTMEVLYRIRKQRPDVFDKLEGMFICYWLREHQFNA